MLRKVWPVYVDWVLLVGWMGVIFYFSSQLHPDVPGVEYSPIRKSMHVAEYVLLFILWWRALHLTWPQHPQGAVRWALAAAIGYAASDELHQHVVGRDGNVADVLIDAILPFFIWLRLEVQQRTVRQPPRPAAR